MERHLRSGELDKSSKIYRTRAVARPRSPLIVLWPCCRDTMNLDVPNPREGTVTLSGRMRCLPSLSCACLVLDELQAKEGYHSEMAAKVDVHIGALGEHGSSSTTR